MNGLASHGFDIRLLLAVTLAVSAALLPLSDAGAQGTQGENREFEGLTRPSKDVDLVLRVPGVLAKMPVTPGQRVKGGDLIAALKSDLEEASVEIARLKAASDHQIRMADVSTRFKEAEVGRIQGLEESRSASDREVTEALVELELAQVKSEAARFEKELLIQQLKREQLALAERRLIAPFDGVILRTLKEVGEGVDELEPIVILVKLDPIWVESNLPAELFGTTAVGQSATAKVAGQSRGGKVVAVDPLVDAASDTFRIVLEVSNEDRRIVAGVAATVRLSPTRETVKQP